MDLLTRARSYALTLVQFASRDIRLQVLTGDRLPAALGELGFTGSRLDQAVEALLTQHTFAADDLVLVMRAITPQDLTPLECPTFAQVLDAAGLDRNEVKTTTAVSTKTITDWRLRRLQPRAGDACRLAVKLNLPVEAIDWRLDFAAINKKSKPRA